MRDRPAKDESEIEVTPEMIEAGALELARYHPDYESLEDGVCRIYKAMGAAKRDGLVYLR